MAGREEVISLYTLDRLPDSRLPSPLSRFFCPPGHQFHSPARCMIAGTSTIRMIVASSSTATANPKPRNCIASTLAKAKTPKTRIMLLDHTSGLRSYVQFFRLAPTRDSAIALLYAEPLRRPPGKSAEYSDLNFLLLGLLVDRVAGEPLDRFAAQEVFAPAGMSRTMFTPPRSLYESVVPTGVWHERLRGRGQSSTIPGPPLFVARITNRRSDIKRPSTVIWGGALQLELAIKPAYRLRAWAYRFGLPGGVSLLKTSRFFSI